MLSVVALIDNFNTAARVGEFTTEYYERMHESCREATRDAALIYSMFGVASGLLAITQCSAFVLANKLYTDYEFFTEPAHRSATVHPVATVASAVGETAPYATIAPEQQHGLIAPPRIGSRATVILPLSPTREGGDAGRTDVESGDAIPMARQVRVVRRP